MTSIIPLDPEVVAELRSLSDAEDPHFFEDQVAIFSRRAGTLLDSLDACAARVDRERLESAAHALAGTAAVIGALRLSGLGRELERGAPTWEETHIYRAVGLIRIELMHVGELLAAETRIGTPRE